MVGNLVQIQDKLKDLSDNQLRDVFSKGTVPQFLVMTEMGRRKEMKEEYQKNQAQAASTVAEDILSPATNMAQGLGALARPQNRMDTQPQNLPIEQSMTTMAPSPQPMANKLPVTRMADGGLAKIKAQDGMSFNRDSYFTGGAFDPEKFASAFYESGYPGSPRARFSPAATERSPSFRAATAMDRLFPQQPFNPLYDRRGRIEAVGSLQRFLRDPDAYRQAILEAQNKAAAKSVEAIDSRPDLNRANVGSDFNKRGSGLPTAVKQTTKKDLENSAQAREGNLAVGGYTGGGLRAFERYSPEVSIGDLPQDRGATTMFNYGLSTDQANALALQNGNPFALTGIDPNLLKDLNMPAYPANPSVVTTDANAVGSGEAELALKTSGGDVIYGSGSENVSPDASGLAALQTEIGNVASRQYKADPNLIPSALTQRETEVTKLLGAINPNAASAYAGFKDKLDTREEGIEEARDEAQGFALIEAALRIAGTKGRTIGEAISDAAPALASYQKSAASLRKEESLIMGEQLKLAQLQEAEKAGRKAEAASLRKELGEIGANIRSIKSEDKKLFNQSKQADIAVLQARVGVANAQTDQQYKQELVKLKKAENNRENASAKNRANRADIEINNLKGQLETETDPVTRQLIGDQIRTQEEIKRSAIATAQAFERYDPYKKATAETQVRGSIVNMNRQRGAALEALRKAQQTAITIQDPQKQKDYLKQFENGVKMIDAQIAAANKTLKSILDGSYTASGGVNRIKISADQLSTGVR